jgi:hypothetical protein
LEQHVPLSQAPQHCVWPVQAVPNETQQAPLGQTRSPQQSQSCPHSVPSLPQQYLPSADSGQTGTSSQKRGLPWESGQQLSHSFVHLACGSLQFLRQAFSCFRSRRFAFFLRLR